MVAEGNCCCSASLEPRSLFSMQYARVLQLEISFVPFRDGAWSTWSCPFKILVVSSLKPLRVVQHRNGVHEFTAPQPDSDGIVLCYLRGKGRICSNWFFGSICVSTMCLGVWPVVVLSAFYLDPSSTSLSCGR